MTVTLPTAETTTPKWRTAVAVLDSAEYTWDEFGGVGLDQAFYGCHFLALSTTGALLVQEALIRKWRERGRLVLLVDRDTFINAPIGQDDPSDRDYDEVHQAAVDSVGDAELLEAAGLRGKYDAWVRHHTDND